MIFEFSFANFKSFKDMNSLNMTSAKIDDLGLKGITTDTKPLLKSKAVYGANASGKSNMVKALSVFLKIIKESVKNSDIIKLIDNYRLSTETENTPTFFQLIFKIENTVYRYGFEGTRERIFSEWLFGKLNKREVPFFIRENNKIIDISKSHFLEGIKRLSLFGDDSEDSLFDEKSLFLTTIASLKGKISQTILNYLNNIIIVSGLRDFKLHEITKKILENDNNRQKVLQLLQLADTGIDDIKLVEFSEQNLPQDTPQQVINDFKGKKTVISEHKKYNKENDVMYNEAFSFLSDESEGTRKIFELSTVILTALTKGCPIIIDEFDARFHPLISKKIVELFNSEQNNTSQLIFITHDTNLLSTKILRRDQIDFIEKDKYGASYQYTLVRFKGVRKNALVERDYIKGKYGAIPFLGDFDQLLK